MVLMVCFNLYGTMPELLLAQEAPQQADRGYLNIVTKRSGLEVRIDGELAEYWSRFGQGIPVSVQILDTANRRR